jgi:hypothetical protein
VLHKKSLLFLEWRRQRSLVQQACAADVLLFVYVLSIAEKI